MRNMVLLLAVAALSLTLACGCQSRPGAARDAEKEARDQAASRTAVHYRDKAYQDPAARKAFEDALETLRELEAMSARGELTDKPQLAALYEKLKEKDIQKHQGLLDQNAPPSGGAPGAAPAAPTSAGESSTETPPAEPPAPPETPATGDTGATETPTNPDEGTTPATGDTATEDDGG